MTPLSFGFFFKRKVVCWRCGLWWADTGLYSAVAVGSESGICQVGATFFRVIASDALPGQTTPGV